MLLNFLIYIWLIINHWALEWSSSVLHHLSDFDLIISTPYSLGTWEKLVYTAFTLEGGGTSTYGWVPSYSSSSLYFFFYSPPQSWEKGVADSMIQHLSLEDCLPSSLIKTESILSFPSGEARERFLPSVDDWRH